MRRPCCLCVHTSSCVLCITMREEQLYESCILFIKFLHILTYSLSNLTSKVCNNMWERKRGKEVALKRAGWWNLHIYAIWRVKNRMKWQIIQVWVIKGNTAAQKRIKQTSNHCFLLFFRALQMSHSMRLLLVGFYGGVEILVFEITMETGWQLVADSDWLPLHVSKGLSERPQHQQPVLCWGKVTQKVQRLLLLLPEIT